MAMELRIEMSILTSFCKNEQIDDLICKKYKQIMLFAKLQIFLYVINKQLHKNNKAYLQCEEKCKKTKYYKILDS